MKKRELNHHISTDFVQVILYLDDVKRIIALMENAGFTTQIIYEDFEYTSIDELIANAGERLNQIKLIGSNEGKEFIFIDYSNGKYRLSTYWTTIGVADLWNSVLKIFNSNIDPWYSRLDPWMLNSGQLTVLVFINLIQDKSSLLYYIGIGFWILVLLISFYAAWYRNFHHKLILINKHKSGIVAKYGKEILLLVIGGVITLIGTLVLRLIP